MWKQDEEKVNMNIFSIRKNLRGALGGGKRSKAWIYGGDGDQVHNSLSGSLPATS